MLVFWGLFALNTKVRQFCKAVYCKKINIEFHEFKGLQFPPKILNIGAPNHQPGSPFSGEVCV